MCFSAVEGAEADLFGFSPDSFANLKGGSLPKSAPEGSRGFGLLGIPSRLCVFFFPPGSFLPQELVRFAISRVVFARVWP